MGRGNSYVYKGERLDEIEPVEFATDRESWECQPGEPSLWYNRFFRHFLVKGPERSVRGAHRTYLRVERNSDHEPKATPTSWRYYSLKYRWAERGEAYDTYTLQKLQESIEDERALMFQRHRGQARQWAKAGLGWLEKEPEHRITSGALALRAWLAGIDIEARSLIPPQLLKLFEMSDAELQQFYDGLIATAVSGGATAEDEGDQG